MNFKNLSILLISIIIAVSAFAILNSEVIVSQKTKIVKLNIDEVIANYNKSNNSAKSSQEDLQTPHE